MMPEDFKNMATELIVKDRWAGLLAHFTEALRINLFLMDCEGRIVLPSSKGRFGSSLLANSAFAGDLVSNPGNFLKKFVSSSGHYLENKMPAGFYSYAIPIIGKDSEILAYLIVGPVIIGQRLDKQDYRSAARNMGLDEEEFLEVVDEVKVLSHLSLKATLDLLAEVLEYGVQMNSQKQELEHLKLNMGLLSVKASQELKDIYSSIYFDELLVSLLDAALSMSKADTGSVMLVDKEGKGLSIKASRGVSKSYTESSIIPLGQGLAGWVVQHKKPLVISGETENNRIKHLLKRPEIRQSLVIPLAVQNTILGVLNLSTYSKEISISSEQTFQAVSHLVSLTASALLNIQQKIETAPPNQIA